MPETRLTSQSTNGWLGASRKDLPAYNRFGNIQNGDLSNAPLHKMPMAGQPGGRNPNYQYVDTGEHAVHHAYILWSDSASWCTMVALWSMGRAGLAHVVPGASAAVDTVALLTAYGVVPTEIHLVTMPAHYNKADGFQNVLATIRGHYGNDYAGIKVFLIDGYGGHDWEQKHQLAVDPKAGAYPVFN